MELIACPECVETSGAVDPLCMMCNGHGEIGVPDLDEDEVYAQFIHGYEGRQPFRAFVAAVHELAGPLLIERGYAPTDHRVPRDPEPSYSKPWRSARYPGQQWFLMINYQYNEESEVLDHREFFINAYRAPVEEPYPQFTLGPGGLHGRVSYREPLWIPEYLHDIVWGYTPIGAEEPARTRLPSPQTSWYYRNGSELRQVLAAGAALLPAYLDWLENPLAERPPHA
ncbi:MAG TPA: hypothetical protein VD886_13890 [Herpetosiphonaceae bacterium]|nr:hypothetical protein [Herpetosiphonaceae bacterium]